MDNHDYKDRDQKNPTDWYYKKKVENKTKKRWYKRWWFITLVAVLAFFLIIGGFFAFQVYINVKEIKNQPFFSPVDGLATNESQLVSEDIFRVATKDDPYVGSFDAKVVIVEFADFLCPACREESYVMRKIIDNYGDNILYIYRDFPALDEMSDVAAMAGECAQEQGKFWEMHDMIYYNQDIISRESLKLMAEQLGLNVANFNNCLDSERFLAEIQEDAYDGVEAGVVGTPTFFINGVRIPGAIPFDVFKQLIDLSIQFPSDQFKIDQ